MADRQRQKDSPYFGGQISNLSPHGKGDLPDKIMHKIRGQLKLSEKDFKDLVACPLTHEGYLEILKRKGLL